MVVWSILDHFGPAHFPTVPQPLPSIAAIHHNIAPYGNTTLRAGIITLVIQKMKSADHIIISCGIEWDLPAVPLASV